MAPAIKPIHTDIPTATAWQAGRRIYIRCGYRSTLHTGLRELGAHWDRDARALWVGTTKKDAVVELVGAHQKRADAIEDIKKLRLWMSIPYEAVDIRTRAKELGAKWDRPMKAWAMPSEEARAEIREAVDTYLRREREKAERIERDRRVRRDREKLEEAERMAAGRARRVERVLTESGRTPTGETATLREVSTRRMNKQIALGMTHDVGDLVRLDDGRPGIVTAVKVWFSDWEDASSMCWHDETADTAHWDLAHTVAIVEPTEEEVAADEAERAEREDGSELHEVMTRCEDTHEGRAEGWSHPGDTVATIALRFGSLASSQPGGRLVLTRDGRVIHQHPGYYDDYRRTQVEITEEDLVARVRALTALGDRVRTHIDQMAYDYTVTVTERRE